MNNLVIVLLVGLPIVTGVAGYFLRRLLTDKKLIKQEEKANELIEKAEKEKQEILLAAKDEAYKIKDSSKKDLDKKEQRLIDLEKDIRRKEAQVDQKENRIENERQSISQKVIEIQKLKEKIQEIKKEQLLVLQKISKTNKETALKNLMNLVEKEYKDDIVKKIKEIQDSSQEEVDQKAREVLTLSIQRLASDLATENTVATISLPSEEMKGRIIGREGRNIQSFEKKAGVDVIIDDTPEAVVISCFDPVRRQIAKIALEKLVSDGRIHPGRIEELLEKAKQQISEDIKKAGDQAIYEVGVAGLHPDLVKILGRLKYRTSYGQNVLKHSVETAHIAGIIASELGYNANDVKKAGLLHDIGKAVDHEVPGSHAIIGMDIAKKYGISEEIIQAIGSHHEEKEQNMMGRIIQAADAISASRPGARRENLESYIKRLEDLENVANGFEGVEKSYAIQAGREVRIFVKPQEIDDLQSEKLAKNIARKIEKELKYPGQIKVHVIRETRAVDYAK